MHPCHSWIQGPGINWWGGMPGVHHHVEEIIWGVRHLDLRKDSVVPSSGVGAVLYLFSCHTAARSPPTAGKTF